MKQTTDVLHGVSYNVFLGKKLDPLVTWLARQNKLQDFYCFQEFPEDRLDIIESQLTGKNYQAIFAAGFIWRRKTYGELIIFDRNKLQLKMSKTISLGGKGQLQLVFIREGHKFDVRLARIATDRTALQATFIYKGRKFSLVDTHLSADVHNRRKLGQAQHIVDALGASMPALVLGDFNYPFGKGLITLMARYGFVAAFENLRTFRFGPGIYWQNDYIFQRNCSVDRVEMKRVSHSDHYPLFFTVSPGRGK
ncbi:MAG TPA: endonuclease/exonuclease/phosphatase family protein [Candidatus Saccharimonadales bacterium]|nr:endonuclease/exonuclease/phosphatase family protein [Candidatus Saccharimonadales bacterium]